MGPYRKQYDRPSDTWLIFEAADEDDKDGQGGQIAEVQTEGMADKLIAALDEGAETALLSDDALISELFKRGKIECKLAGSYTQTEKLEMLSWCSREEIVAALRRTDQTPVGASHPADHDPRNPRSEAKRGA